MDCGLAHHPLVSCVLNGRGCDIAVASGGESSESRRVVSEVL